MQILSKNINNDDDWGSDELVNVHLQPRRRNTENVTVAKHGSKNQQMNNAQVYSNRAD
jgi:hypothetical protein